MFSGIIEDLGTIENIELSGTNYTFTILSNISKHLKVDQSLAHNGVCLTVESCDQNRHKVTAVEETILKTNLSQWAMGTKVNLERCISLNSLLDGHIVQGHVDCKGTISKIEDKNGSYILTIAYEPKYANLIIEKGSIAINGISLTVFNVGNNSFSVTIIPYTWQHTMLHQAKVNEAVNLEFDVLGKYIARNLELKG